MKWICFVSAFLATTGALSLANAADRPNILVILSDDQGWGDIGYHNPKVYTPNLDRLAAEGVRFRQHYVMPQCTPTRVALFTGRFPGRFGITGLQATNDPVFPYGTVTLASLLKSCGYETYLVGKWHMGSALEYGPNHYGFDHSYGALAGAVGAYDHRYRPGNPFEITWHRDLKIIPGYENGTHVTDLLAAEAVRIIKQRHAKPFFLYLPFFAPHTPLDERGPFVDTPTQRDPEHPDRWLNEDAIPWFHDPAGKIQQEKDPERRLLLAVVHHLDDAIGRVVRALDETGQRENTVIFFSSDNGPQHSWNGNAYPDDLRLTDFNQPIPFRGVKGDVYEGGVRVPGFINWPGKIPPREVDTPVHIVDWLPTIASIADAELPSPSDQPGFDGVDLSPIVFGKADVLPERPIYLLHRTPPDKWALRSGDWKIVCYTRKQPTVEMWELYNLADDPKESRNVAAEHPDIVAKLHELFLRHRAKDKSGRNLPQG
ncbi:arylsulfatase [Thermostilla marina]